MENIAGSQLGPYQVVAPLGEGGMAAVYKGYQASIDRYVALKVLPRMLATDPQYLGRFKQEAKIVAKLQHPHILPVYDYGQSSGYTFIVMPYIAGGTLGDLLRGMPVSMEQTTVIVSQLANALDYAHAKGLIHRDIKPSNVLIDENSNCLLTDFGIAKIFASTSRFTSTGGIIGTPDYMSPEQGLGQELDRRSDVYSLGVMLYEMATGRVPFKAETPIATVMKHIHDPLPPPREFNSALPEPVEKVIMRALEKDPADRYPTAGDLAAALQYATGNDEIDPTVLESLVFAGAATDRQPVEASKSRSRWPLFVLIIGLLLLVCGGSTYALYNSVFRSSEESSSVATLPAEEAAEPAGVQEDDQLVSEATSTLSEDESVILIQPQATDTAEPLSPTVPLAAVPLDTPTQEVLPTKVPTPEPPPTIPPPTEPPPTAHLHPSLHRFLMGRQYTSSALATGCASP